MAINITADPFVVTLQANQPAVSHYPLAERNPELDKTMYLAYPSSTSADITCSIHGSWSGISHIADPFVVNTSILSTHVKGLIINADPFVVYTSFEEVIAVYETAKSNKIQWSNIGDLDFTKWKDNVAGDRRVNLAGWVYALLKLGNKIVYYGESGVAYLMPNGVYWGEQVISKIGIKSKQAVCGNNDYHFFIDTLGRLYKLGDKLDLLGYDEYINAMLENVVLSLDELNGRVHICDGITGYIYDIASKSFSSGPGNITGVGVRGGSIYYAASGAVTIPAFSIVTDIIDMGSRKMKTIYYLDIGTDLETGLYAAIDYRYAKDTAFATTPWTKVNPNGRANLPCGGIEFRFRLKTLVYETFELDYMRVVGMLHNYSWLDSFSLKG